MNNFEQKILNMKSSSHPSADSGQYLSKLHGKRGVEVIIVVQFKKYQKEEKLLMQMSMMIIISYIIMVL